MANACSTVYDQRTAVFSRAAGDISSLATVPESTSATAEFLAKQDGVLAGVAVANLVFQMVDPQLEVRGRQGRAG